MRLLKCYIENFGKLSGFEYNFSDGLNVVASGNGSGKTTLATFIKTMLYGFPQTRSRDLDENLRKKYLPWQGGTCGGYLEISVGGKDSSGKSRTEKKYRIERTFGQKESADTFKLVNPDTGKESFDYSENIGFELFGIDSDAYSKSTYIPQIKRKNSGQNDTIGAKLAGLVEESDDIGQYDDAIARLDKKRLFYSAPTKGQIGLITAKLETAKLDFAESERAERELEDSVIPSIEEKETELGEMTKHLSALKEEYEKKNGSLIKEKTEAIARRTECQNVMSFCIKKKDKLKEQKEEYEKLLSYFSGKQPQRAELDKATAVKAELERLDNERKETASKAEELELFEKLEKRFSNAPITSDELDNMLASCGKRKSKPGIGSAFAVLGVILVISAVAIGVLTTAARILIFAVAGAAFLLSVLFFAGAFDRTGKELSQKLRAYYPDHSDSDDPTKAILALRDELAQRDRLSEQIVLENLRKTELDKKYSAAEEEIKVIFGDLGVVLGNEKNYKEILSDAKEKADRLALLYEQINLSEAELSEYISENESVINEYKSGSLAENEKALSESERELVGLREKIDQLDGEIQTLSGKIHRERSEADRISEISEMLPDRSAALKELLERKKFCDDELFAVTKAIGLLKEAKTGLSTRYLGDMREGFNKMMMLIANEDGFALDQSFAVTANRNGAGRSEEYFSSGYRDLIDVCVSLSLTEALFAGEKPWLILDDPFVNLDDEKLEKALRFVSELAKERQVVYLVCHESRKTSV